MLSLRPARRGGRVALFTRAWIEITEELYDNGGLWSPSLRGRGLKLYCLSSSAAQLLVALFTRAWIEIKSFVLTGGSA